MMASVRTSGLFVWSKELVSSVKFVFRDVVVTFLMSFEIQKANRSVSITTPPVAPGSPTTPSPLTKIQTGHAYSMLQKLVSEADSKFVAVNEEVIVSTISHARSWVFMIGKKRKLPRLFCYRCQGAVYKRRICMGLQRAKRRTSGVSSGTVRVFLSHFFAPYYFSGLNRISWPLLFFFQLSCTTVKSCWRAWSLQDM